MINGNMEKGFTLIEAMVSMVIVSVALLSLGAFTLTIIRSDSTAKQRTVATHVAEQALERWFSSDIAPAATTTVTVNGAVYQFQSFDVVPISGVSNVAMAGANTATAARGITVYWRNASGVHKVTVVNMQRAR